MPSFNTSTEWFKSGEMDYFSGFIKMWLSAISVIKIVNQNRALRKERDLIEFIKSEPNPLKTKYGRLADNVANALDDESNKLSTYLEILIKQYDGGLFGGKSISKDVDIGLKPQMNGVVLDDISFKDFIHNSSFVLKRRPKGYIKFGKLYLRENLEDLFPYLIEILYMVRNLLFHGELNINDDNKKILEASYNILKILISDTISNANS